MNTTARDLAINSPGDDTEAAVVRDLTAQAIEAQTVVPGDVILRPDGPGRMVLADLEEFGARPRFASAHRTFYDAASFARYLDVHTGRDTEVFADVREAKVVAVIDSHSPAAHHEAGWQKHRATLALTTSPSWDAWLARDGDLMGQVEFAEFVELNADDVRAPASADLLDLAQTFEATKAVEYESSERLADGQTRLKYRETVTAKAGQKGDVEIPQSLTLGIRPYIGGPTYAVRARFRYRIDAQRLRLGYVIERPQIVLDAAFEDVLLMLRNGKPESAPGEGDQIPAVTAPIYLGRP